MTHSAAGWCRARLGGAGRESRAELDSGYGRRGCFMAVALRLAGGCFVGSIIASLFITCILGVFLCRACLFLPGLSERSREHKEVPEDPKQPIPTTHLLTHM